MNGKFEQRYIGDGVYASFDGYQVWLHVNRHDAPPCVALEPAVLKALNQYYRDVISFAQLRKDVSHDPRQ